MATSLALSIYILYVQGSDRKPRLLSLPRVGVQNPGSGLFWRASLYALYEGKTSSIPLSVIKRFSKNGSILLSSNQIKEKKLDELPTNIVIFATTSQFVENISEGLRIIKNRGGKFIPTNITAIQDFETEKEKDFMSYGSSTKNLYLLLLEDL